jgi:ligand-binding SRPBCC domain-containing protein
VSVFVSASGIGYYGDRGTEELTEASAPGGDFLARLCGDWERAAEAFPAHRIARLRFGVVLSPTGGFLRRIAPMMLRFGASQLGGGGQYLSWIHVDDAANAILYALERPEARGAYNVTAPQPVTNAAMTAALSDIFGGPHMPAAPALALRALYGELADLLLGSQRGLPARLLAEGFTFAHPEFAAAARAVYPGLGPGEMQVHREQWLPLAPDALWAFFTSEQNLEKITPPFLNFHVVGKSTPQIERGTTIDYRLKLHGLPIRWRSRIAEWRPDREFVDEQVRGPYARWRHRHAFEPLAGGTLARDTVQFALPFGFAGRAAGLGFVLSDVDKIFAYRAKTFAALYPGG